MKRHVWLWIIGGALALFAVGCLVAVGTTAFLVSRQVNVDAADESTARREFERVRERFGDQSPIFEDEARTDAGVARLRMLASEYAGPAPTNLHVLAWDERDQRLVRISIPFWLLRLGRSGTLQFGDLDVDRMRLDAEELEQAGPVLLMDRTGRDGRVLLWTE